MNGETMINDADIREANMVLLRACLDIGKTATQIMEQPAVRLLLHRVTETDLKDVLYSLANTPLVFRRGVSNGTFYRTTRVGRIVLEIMEKGEDLEP